MTEQEFLRVMLNNQDVSIAMEREKIWKAEARIECAEGYKQALSNRLRELEKRAGEVLHERR